MNTELNVGQEVLLCQLRFNVPKGEPEKGNIIKIGRTYFYVKMGWQELQFNLNSNVEKGGYWKAYFSEQEMSDEQEAQFFVA